MNPRASLALAAPLLSLLLSSMVSGCGITYHQAEIRSARLSPPAEPVTRHSSPIWLEIDPGVVPSQCVLPRGQRKLCFEDVHGALATALSQSLWTSFPDAPVLGPGDEPHAGDYRLVVELRMEAVPPSEGGPGWAALGRGKFRLVRDQQTLATSSLESRSRAEFAYGKPLGIGAAEVIDAIASHIAGELSKIPETQTAPERTLPTVSVTGTSTTAKAQLEEPYMASASSNVALSSSE
jgi:hypothetical protein